MAPAPNSFHQAISCNLVYLLRQYLEQPNAIAGKLFHAPIDVYLSDWNVVQPDLVFIGRERLACIRPEGILGAPTLVIEILSDRTQSFDRTTKKQLYQSSGIEELWLIDPTAKQVEIHRPNAPVSIFTLEQHDRLTSVCFPGLQLHCAAIFTG